jgi:hypothetical protein
MRVLAECAAVDQLWLDPKSTLEVIENVAQNARPRSGRQTEEWGRGVVSAVLLNEAADVAVVGAEVLPPLREAVRFVDDPVANLALIKDRTHGRISQLLG